MRKVKIIGLTGQSGAGKSTAAKLFEKNGFTVINADVLVADIYVKSPVCLNAVAAQFGGDIINSDGTLNRKILAKRAFASKENTALLGTIVHPFVIAETLKILKSSRGCAVLDAPQLFESNLDVVCDFVVSIVADRQTRLKRIIARDNITCQQAEERISAQYSEDFFKENSDYTIQNNADLQSYTYQLCGLIDKIRAEVM